jgi:phosphosulfolactate phosphohydrolase-like enzyme
MLMSGSALLGAQANITATAQAALTAALQAYAVGHMAGDTVDDSVLTAQAIAHAVGERIIEAGLSADDVARLLLAFAAGNATGLEGADPKFFAQDGTTVRIDGSYSGGNRSIDSINGS